MSVSAGEVLVELKIDEKGEKDWEFFFITQNGETKKVFLDFKSEENKIKDDETVMYPLEDSHHSPAEYETEIYIEYDTVQKYYIDEDGDEDCDDYELSNEEETAIIEFIIGNYGF
jgi:hypothetical protein